MQTTELTLRDYLVVIRRRWPIIAGVTVVLALAGFLYSTTQTKQYSASTEVLIDFELSAQITDPANQGRSISDRERRTENELRYASSDSVNEVARQQLGDEDAEVTVKADSSADILVFTAVDADPANAAIKANTFAQAYTSTRAARNAEKFTEALTSVETVLEELRGDLAELAGSDTPEADVERAAIQQQIQTYEARKTAYGLLADANKDTSAAVINPAKTPEVPVSPKPMRTAALALTLGLLASTGLAFLLEFIDDRVRTKEELEAVAAAPTLALIPRNKETGSYSPADEPDDSLLAESFRSLRTSLRFAALRQPLRSIQVTSANPSEGKTTVVCYLAVAMARLGNPVVLIDGDLRNPSVHRRFAIPNNDQGLAAVLLRQTDIEGAMWAVAGVPNLWVLPSGPAPANPGDLLWPADGRTGMLTVPEVIAQLMDAGYTVIVDSPPVMPVADAVTLSRTVEGTIFVANAGTTRARTLQRSLEQLDRADARVVGMVLNRSAEAMGGYRYGYRSAEQSTVAPSASPIPPVQRPPAPPVGTVPVLSGAAARPEQLLVPVVDGGHTHELNGRAMPPVPAANGHAVTNGHGSANGGTATNGHGAADLEHRLRNHLGLD